MRHYGSTKFILILNFCFSLSCNAGLKKLYNYNIIYLYVENVFFFKQIKLVCVMMSRLLELMLTSRSKMISKLDIFENAH